MSEASGSVVQETLEPHHLVEGEMATAAVGQGMGRYRVTNLLYGLFLKVWFSFKL